MSDGQSVSFDRIADRYDDTRGGDARGKRWAAFLDPYFADGGRTLEIGVGTGVVGKALRDRGRPVVGIDLSPRMLSYARERLGPSVALADAQRLPVATASLRNAYSTYVLHLVGDLEATLGEAARVLAQRGRYLVLHSSSRDGDQISALIGELRAALGRAPGTTTAAISTAAATAGFVLDEVVADSPFSFRESPASAAGEIEDRTFSWSWDVSSDAWTRHVEPGIAELRAMPDADIPIARTSSNDLLVLTRA